MSLIERQIPLDRLRALLAEAAVGKGQVAALTGEAGVGKSALVREFAGSAAADARVLRGACEDLATPEPLGPLQDLAREAGWDLRQALKRGGRIAAFSEAREIFDAGGRPCLIVVEDLHWADDATIDFIRYLGRRIHDSRMLLVVTARSDEAAARGRVRRALADIPADIVTRIDVPLLSRGAVDDLARSAGVDGEAIYRATAGNAFYVTELLRAGSPAELPASVSDAVLMRAGRLPPAAREVLDAVSIFPRRAEPSLVQDVSGRDCMAEIEECVATGILTVAEDGCAFRHEIARRAIEAALSPRARRALNARALAALLERGGVASARLAHHAEGANDSAAIRTYAPLAGEEAARLGAHREAADHFHAALAHANTFSLGERLNLYERYAFECHLVGRMEQAIAAQKAALAVHRADGDARREGDSLRWLSRLSYLAGNRFDADRFGEQAIELLGPLPPGAEQAMAYSNLSQLAMLANRADEAVAYGEKAIALAEPAALDRPDILCHALNNVGSAIQWRDLDRARDLIDRSLAIALAHDFQEHAARSYTNRCWLELIWQAYDQAAIWLDTGIGYCIERDLDTWRDYMRGLLADLHLRKGNWDEAAVAAHLVLANDDAAALARFPAGLALARLRTRRGDSADELLADLAHFLETGMELQRLAPYAALLAERAWLGLAERDLALALLDQAKSLAPDDGMIPEIFHWQRMLGLPAHPHPAARMPRPYELLIAGDWQGAADCWQQADAPYEEALALLQGNHAAQRRALAVLESLGASAAVEHGRMLLRQSGARTMSHGPRASTRSNPSGLTRRQMDVLRLIDQGRSNGEIATALFVSTKTVDHHISAILGKLQAKSRGEAAAIARSTGLIRH